MKGKRVSWELVGALVVVLSAISSGTYFYMQAQSPVNVVRAVEDIPYGCVIAKENVTQTTVKKKDIPDWIKGAAYYQNRPFRPSYGAASLYVDSEKDVVGGTSAGISKGQLIFKGGGGCCETGGCDFKGFDLSNSGWHRHHHRQ
jgi:hypothetical protein